MARALALAERGLYTTTPNPRVGCVIVTDGADHRRRLARARRRGARRGQRARRRAGRAGTIRAARRLYVTLEPCNHTGRTPPCTEALIAAGIARVVAAMRDPNPGAAHGAARLRAAGRRGRRRPARGREARELNVGFVSRMTRGRPWVRMKVAASLDGRTALANGESQWITGEAARADGHRWRARACAVLTGIGTVRQDDPQLTVRGGRDAAPAAADRRRPARRDAAAARGARRRRRADRHRGRRAIRRGRAGVEVLALPDADGPRRPRAR